jgi:hypothetical protein
MEQLVGKLSSISNISKSFKKSINILYSQYPKVQKAILVAFIL